MRQSLWRKHAHEAVNCVVPSWEAGPSIRTISLHADCTQSVPECPPSAIWAAVLAGRAMSESSTGCEASRCDSELDQPTMAGPESKAVQVWPPLAQARPPPDDKHSK